MSLWELVTGNLKGNSFRSCMVFLCVLVVAGLTVAVSLIVRGAENNAQLTSARLGADLVVIPRAAAPPPSLPQGPAFRGAGSAGMDAPKESALLMGRPIGAWMPDASTVQIASVPGVEAASPQLYLGTLSPLYLATTLGLPYSSEVSEAYLVAFDPATDFCILPWLGKPLGSGLKIGEALVGVAVPLAAGAESITLRNYSLRLAGELRPTGTDLDRGIFFNFDTARELTRAFGGPAVLPIKVAEPRTTPYMPPNNITAVMVRTLPGADINLVAEKILVSGPNLSTISNPNLYRTFQNRLGEMARAYLGMVTLAWVISLLIQGVIFSVAANERRREVAVLFAVGSGRGFVLRLLLAEAMLLALGGGTAGVLVGAMSVYLLQGGIAGFLGMPLQLPPASESLPVVGGGLVLALIGVTVAALYPALRVSRQEPAQAMRE